MPAAQLLGNRWHCASDKNKIDWLLNGISRDDFDTNVMFSRYVQSFISLSRTVSVNLYSFVCVLFDRHMHC